jgi:hypothetical protein
MLRNAKTLEGFELRARDGQLGHVRDFYFDDEQWIVRYLVVDTGGWLSGRRVLISPTAVEGTEGEKRTLAVALTQAQVKNSPGVEREQPVTRDEELQLTQYYNWPTYWAMSGAGYADGGLGMSVPPPVLPDPALERALRRRVECSAVAEHHLRSVRQVTGFDLEAADGAIGHVIDFLIDERRWGIRYIVVDTRNWLPGKKVLVAPQWIHEVGWEREKVFVDLTRDAVKASPAYDPTHPPTPDYAQRLHDHYGRPRYDPW